MFRFKTLIPRIGQGLLLFVLFSGWMFAFPAAGRAAIAQTINYQARLWTAAGTAVTDGSYSVKFSLYTTASGGTPIWTAAGTTGTPTAITVTVTNGQFTTLLGDIQSGQNSFSGVDWNQAALYLGVTVGADAEMTPRRPFSAVPQAFVAQNALTLQGMSPTGSVGDGETLFTIHQTNGSAAAATRSALDVRSDGTSNARDYLFRGIDDAAKTVFSLSRQGNVAASGSLNVGIVSASSTVIGNVLLGASTRDMVVPSGFAMDGDDTYVGDALGVVGGIYTNQGTYVGASATFYGAQVLTTEGAYSVSSTLALGLRGAGGLSSMTLGTSGISLESANGLVTPVTDLGLSLGSKTNRFNGYFGAVTSTDIIATNVTTTNFYTENVSTTHLQVGTVSSTSIGVTGNISANTVDASSIVASSNIFTTNLGATGAITNRISTQGFTSLGSYTTSMAGIQHTQVSGDRLYVQTTQKIFIFDVSDPTGERLIGTIEGANTQMGAFVVKGNLLYFVYQDMGDSSTHLGTADIRNPVAPAYGAGITLSLTSLNKVDIAVSGQGAYISSGDDNAVFVYNVGDLSGPTYEGSIPFSDIPEDILTDGRSLYVLTSDGLNNGHLSFFSLAEPLQPTLSSVVTVGEAPEALAIKGGTVYVMNSADFDMMAVNVTNPLAATVIQTANFGYSGTSAVVFGDRLVIGSLQGIVIISDISSSTAATVSGALTIGAAINSLAADGTHLFIGMQTNPYLTVWGLAGVTVDALNGGRATFYAVNVRGEVQIQNDLQVTGGVTVGSGGIYSQGTIASTIESPTSTAGSFINTYTAGSNDNAWGLFTNRLLVGENTSATGSRNYVAAFAYNESAGRFGVCLDNTATPERCLGFANTTTIYSLMADDAIGANAFDLAERYSVTGEASVGDVLVLDSDQPLHMKRSSGVPYDDRLSGVVSTRPGFILGTGGDVSVALIGRVPVNVTVSNGVIVPGDGLTSSDRPGYAMKATRAGKIIGRALQGATADGQIEVYLQPGFDASPLLQADGGMTVIAQDTGFQAVGVASAAQPVQSSRALSFRGNAWDGASSVASEFRLFNQVDSPTASGLTVAYGASSSSVFRLSQDGSLTLAGDLALAGKLYPSARGQAQRESYLFVDDSQPGSRYMSTNADGWQSQDGYDYAERYQSPDALEPGDLVVVKRSDRLYVQRSLNATDMLVGIVSTRPGFVAGKVQEDSYPIALAGRVPTKVSTMNGAISPGDPLAPSTIPGVAVKATKPGPIVGLALDSYADADVGKIEVFVNPTWWGGESEGVGEPVRTAVKKEAQGFGEITSGQTRVHIALSGFTGYPHLQVTPYSQMEEGWWIDQVSSAGFDLVLGGTIGHNARFAWSATEAADDAQVSLSNGHTFQLDPISGQIQFPPDASDAPAPVEPVPPVPETDEAAEEAEEPSPQSTSTQETVSDDVEEDAPLDPVVSPPPADDLDVDVTVSSTEPQP